MTSSGRHFDGIRATRLRHSRKISRLLGLLAAWLPVCSMLAASEPQASTEAGPRVSKFKDGKIAAFSMQFDDSMETQADFAIPELNKRGLVGSFFINPDSDRYRRRREVWEVECPKHGHELANHTLRHRFSESRMNDN